MNDMTNFRDNGPFRTMPHNPEAEQSVLGAIFVENGTTILHAVAPYLKTTHFRPN